VDQRPEGDDEITLGLDVVGAYFLNGEAMPKEQVEAKMTEMYAARTEDKILFFKADAGLKYSVVQEAVEVARRSGARVLVAITDRSGGLMQEEK
jgi:biopolymer transport protein ExbD